MEGRNSLSTSTRIDHSDTLSQVESFLKEIPLEKIEAPTSDQLKTLQALNKDIEKLANPSNPPQSDPVNLTETDAKVQWNREIQNLLKTLNSISLNNQTNRDQFFIALTKFRENF